MLVATLTACEPARDVVLRALLPWERAAVRATCVLLRGTVPAAACAPSVDAMARRGTLSALMRYDAPTPPRVLSPHHVRAAIEADNVDALRWMRACGLSLRLDESTAMYKARIHAGHATEYAASCGSERALAYLCEVHGRAPGHLELTVAVACGHGALATRLAESFGDDDALAEVAENAATRGGVDGVVRAYLRRAGAAGGARFALRTGCRLLYEELFGVSPLPERRVTPEVALRSGDLELVRRTMRRAHPARRQQHVTPNNRHRRRAAQRAWIVRVLTAVAEAPRNRAALLGWVSAEWPETELRAALARGDSARLLYDHAVAHDNADALAWLRACCGFERDRHVLAKGRCLGQVRVLRHILGHTGAPDAALFWTMVMKGIDDAVLGAMLDALGDGAASVRDHELARVAPLRILYLHRFRVLRTLRTRGLLPPGVAWSGDHPLLRKGGALSLSATAAAMEAGCPIAADRATFLAALERRYAADAEWCSIARRLCEQHRDLFAQRVPETRPRDGSVRRIPETGP